MKIKDLIKHLETLDQEKELVILATDPTDWTYGQMVDDTTIELSEVYPSEENGLEEIGNFISQSFISIAEGN